MSVFVPIKKLCAGALELFERELIIEPKETDYGKGNELILYDIFPYKKSEEQSEEEEVCGTSNDTVSVPMRYYYNNLDKITTSSLLRDPKGIVLSVNKKVFPQQRQFSLGFKLRKEQRSVSKEVISKLNNFKTCLLHLPCAFGKTNIAIYLAHKIKNKTCIIVIASLIQQWKARIEHFASDAVVQVLHVKTKVNDAADFYLMNIGVVYKRNRKDFENIGTLIVDECDMSCTEVNSRAYTYFSPEYLIGLTATPFRSDGMHTLLNAYMGFPECSVKRVKYRPFNVYKLNTIFKPKVSFSRMGKLDWNAILNSQTGNVERNDLIIEILKYFKDVNFIVLCKRIEQANYLYNKLRGEESEKDFVLGSDEESEKDFVLDDIPHTRSSCGEEVDIYTGGNKFFNEECRILISTYSKSGVGFDWSPRSVSGNSPHLALLIASDVEARIEQYLGRCQRIPDDVPMVIDVVDDFGVFVKHWRTRRKLYVDVGGCVSNFKTKFKDFGLDGSVRQYLK